MLQEVIGPRFQELLRSRFTLERHTVAHALLAGLGSEAVVTTNYDNGYELAAAAVQPTGRQLRVLPREHAQAGSPWLLKMHGDVALPESIVLTRQHYLEYADARTPLTGMVQALLMTRHMLFVGFSLVDDNFARLAYQVRRVLVTGGSLDQKVGTVLALRADPAREKLWEPDLDHVAMAEPPARDDEEEATRALVMRGARRLELFLDRLAWRAANVRGGRETFLLDPRYDAVQRSPAEEALRQRLLELERSAGPEERNTAAWQAVGAALRSLGAK